MTDCTEDDGYLTMPPKHVEPAIEKVKLLSEQRQHHTAKVLEQIAAAGDRVYLLHDDERRLVREGLDELEQGKAATEDEVRAVFDKFRLRKTPSRLTAARTAFRCR